MQASIVRWVSRHIVLTHDQDGMKVTRRLWVKLRDGAVKVIWGLGKG